MVQPTVGWWVMESPEASRVVVIGMQLVRDGADM